MLSIQHILHSLYTYDMTYLHRYGASVVYPDAIRAYTNGSRKYSHFEHVFRDKYYYMVFPLSMDAPRKIIEEHIKEVKEEIEAEIPSEFQSEILKPCAIGEDTSLTLFCKTNTDLPEKMYTGIVTHLKQDIAFDKFIRMHIDCSKSFETNSFSMKENGWKRCPPAYYRNRAVWHLRIGIFDFQRKRNLMQSVMAFREDQANS